MRKKFIGTGIYLLILGIAVLAIGRIGYAQFNQTPATLLIDGVISGLHASGFEVDTPGAQGVAIGIDTKTVFTNGLALDDFGIGDRVSVVAKNSGSVAIAKVIKKLKGYGYGTEGDTVVINRATVVGKTPTTMTVDSGLATVLFEVTASTIFSNKAKNFAALSVGDEVKVIGKDAGLYFVAKTVVVY